MKPSIFVATPVHRTLESEFIISFLTHAQSIARAGGGLELNIHNGDSLVHRARNIQAYQFLQSKCTHFFCWDSDEAIEPASALVDLVNLKLDVVGIPVPLKKIHWDKVLEASRKPDASAETLEHAGKDFAVNPFIEGGYQLLDFQANGCAEVDTIGTGALLISRNAMTKLAAAAFANGFWFSCKREPWRGVAMPLIFDTPIDEHHDLLSEDYALCRAWRNLGGKVWLYSGAKVTHVGHLPYVGDLLSTFSEEAA